MTSLIKPFVSCVIMDSKCLFAACSPESSAKFYRRDGYHFNSAGITNFSIVLADFVNKNFRSLNVFLLDNLTDADIHP